MELLYLMLSPIKKYLLEIRTAAVFLLIAAFVLLSYCPLRRTIQTFVNGTNHTEQRNIPSGKLLATIACQAAITDSNTKWALTEPTPDQGFKILAALVPAFFCSGKLFSASQASDFYSKSNPGYLNSVPIYLKNKILLI